MIAMHADARVAEGIVHLSAEPSDTAPPTDVLLKVVVRSATKRGYRAEGLS